MFRKERKKAKSNNARPHSHRLSKKPGASLVYGDTFRNACLTFGNRFPKTEKQI